MFAIVDVLVMSFVASAVPELLPPPQEAEWPEGTLSLPKDVDVALPESRAEQIEPLLWILDEALASRGSRRIDVREDAGDTTIRIHEAAGDKMVADSYVLEVDGEGMRIGAQDAGGVFNGLATLAQLIEQGAGDPVAIPACRIRDWPALPMRAVHIDLTCQHYTAKYVQELMRTLARYKVNAILMEYSDMFPFRKHSAIRRPDAFTEDDVRSIRDTAAACNQELIPFLQCLGHLEYVLHREEYAHYGKTHNRYMYCPSAEATMPLVRELIDEVLDQHPGIRHLHVGGDEVSTYECERCLAYTKEHGFSSLYVEHYAQVADYCRDRGVTPLMWSDMVLKHPEALAELPRNVSWVVWDYFATTEPAPSVCHGASMDRLDQIKPDYRKYFGKGIGLPEARGRGGLLAFGHARGFKDLGFDAFISPAARCSGDNFDLPRYGMHMANIRLAFLKAVAYELPGSIVTSWSYRGSPHEVCLPEYVCTSYGWNTATPDIGELLARFFRQRYGIDGTKLAEAVLAESSIVPPSTLARPTLDDEKRAWRLTAAAQLEQIKRLAGAKADTHLTRLQQQLEQLTRSESLWQEAIPKARRHQRELRHWGLSHHHLMHRLRFVPPALQLIRSADAGADADKEQMNKWRRQLESLAGPRDKLRREWAELYGESCTPRHLETDIYNRFDAETAIIEGLLSGE